MKRAVVLVTIIASVGCKSSVDLNCIKPPETRAGAQTKQVVEIAASLEGLPLDATLKPAFEQKVDVTFVELNDSNVALLLLLRAIECYVARAKSAEERAFVEPVVGDLVATVRAHWGAEHGLRGAGPELSPKERVLLEDAPQGPQILAALERLGVR